MKNLVLAAFVLFMSLNMYAQYGKTSGGPDPYGYRYKTSDDTIAPATYKWFDITSIGTQVTGLGDDNYVGPFTITNNFQYYWYWTPQFYIGSNGFISFNGVNIASPFPASIPNPAGGNDFIAPLLSDLNFSGTGNPAKCYYYQNADTLCISFIDVPYWALSSGYTGSNTFQIILNAIDNSITFNYKTMNSGSVVTPDNIVGIENITGTLGLNTFIDSLPAANLAIKYTYPASTTYQAKDVGINWNDNPDNGGVFVNKDGIPKPFQASIKNFGNVALSNIMVYDTVYTLTGSPISNGSASIASLAPGQAATVTFSDSFSAPSKATYVLRTSVAGLSGDLVGANNTSDLEVIAIDTTAAVFNLDYSDGTPDGTGLGWNGGGGGIAKYFKPSVYPAKVKDTRFYITTLGTPAVGFYSKLYDDDGPNGGPGTLLDSVFVGPGTISINNYKNVNPSKPIIIDSGGVYLFWSMAGAGINLARDLTEPISRRTYEVLGGSWSGYRDRLTEDFLMGIRVTFAYPRADFGVKWGNNPTLEFVDKSTNSPTSWFWEFGDGSTDTLQNPSHTYINNDTFKVCLTATNQYGSDSICKLLYIDGNIPTADFSYDSIGSPTIIFTDESINDPTAWHWDFGAGIGDTANTQNVAFKFPADGTYNVCLTAINKNGASAPICKSLKIGYLGVAQLANTSFDLFPNPMTDYATIRISSEMSMDQFEVALYNLLGKAVPVRTDRLNQDIRLYKDGLPAGHYIVEIRSQKQGVARMQLQVSE